MLPFREDAIKGECMAQIILEVKDFDDINLLEAMRGEPITITGKAMMFSWGDMAADINRVEKLEQELDELKNGQ